MSDEALASAKGGDQDAFARLVSPYRRELRAHCYRMSGSLHDADDLLQESLLRAWKGLRTFEGRASVRTWLYRVTTNACLDALDQRAARRLPPELGPPSGPGDPVGPPTFERPWLEPYPSEQYGEEAGPEARYDARESVALAFLVALQLLPPKQRAVLILRDVLGWQASECAEPLGLSVAAVNSALQRARETLATKSVPEAKPSPSLTEVLGRYVRAWEQADVSSLVALLSEEATLSMPPMAEWFRGRDAIGASIGAMVFTASARGSFRLVETRANGLPAFMTYQRDEASGAFGPLALHVLELSDDRITSITAFIDPRLAEKFGLPASL